MNPAGQPGQPGQMAPGQANGQQPQRPQIYRPSDMDTLPIPEADKLRYKNGLSGLWRTMSSHPKGTQQHTEASRKITEFSAQLAAKIRANPRPPSQAAGGFQGGAPNSQGTQGSPTTHSGPEPNTTASAGSPPASASGQPAPATATAGAPTAQGQQSQAAGRPMGVAMNPQIRQHVTETVAHAPQEVVDQGQESVAQWLNNRRERYGTALIRMQQISTSMKEIEARTRTLQQKSSTMTPDEQKLLQDLANKRTTAHAAHLQAKTIAENIRKEQAGIKEARGLPNGPGSSSQQPNSAVEAQKGQQPGVVGRMAGANGQAGQQPPQSTQAPPQASPVTTAPSAPSATSQQQVKVEPGMAQPQVLPPVNTAIASAAAAGMPSAGTPTQGTARMPNTPIQTATPTTGAPHSLSHSAALNLANQSRSSQPVIPNQTPQQGTPQGTGGTPSSAGVMGSTAQQPGHPHAHPGQQQPQTAIPHKLPIPKHLPEKAAMPPQPVSTNLGGVAPGRPTYTQGGGTAGGVMGQPILPKIPVVQMEGEGERVMNRKKLDDLVRQVCGGQAEGQEGNVLTPDVEEVRGHLNVRCLKKEEPLNRISLSFRSFQENSYADQHFSVDPQPRRLICRPPPPLGLRHRQATWLQGSRDPRYPTRAGAHVQHTHTRLRNRRAPRSAQSTARCGLAYQDQRYSGIQSYW